jgi:hypothetical protein
MAYQNPGSSEVQGSITSKRNDSRAQTAVLALLCVFCTVALYIGGCACSQTPASTKAKALTWETSANLPNGTVGKSYSTTLQTTGGSAPITYKSILTPPGLALTLAGIISGKPTTANTFSFAVTATDSANKTATQTFNITINPGGPPVITGVSPSSFLAGSKNTLVTVTGTGFDPGLTAAIVDNFGNVFSAIPTTVSPTQFTFPYPGTHLFTAGTGSVSGVNPSSAGGASNSFPIVINDAITNFATTGAIVNTADDVDQNADSSVVAAADNTGGFIQIVVTDSFGNRAPGSKLPVPGGGANGLSVTVSGDGTTVAAGNCRNSTCIGSGYVWVDPTGAWQIPTMSPIATLVPATPLTGGEMFGSEIRETFNGDTIMMTALGAKYIALYQKPSGGWAGSITPFQVITAGSSGPANFAQHADIDGLGLNLASASAGNLTAPGQIDVYSRTAVTATFLHQAILRESNPQPGDGFPSFVRITEDSNVVLSGAPKFCTTVGCTGLGQGVGFVWTKNLTAVWADALERALLKAFSGAKGDGLAYSGSISSDGSNIVLGAPLVGSTPTAPGPGKGYLYQIPSGGWTGQVSESGSVDPYPGTDINNGSFAPTNSLGLRLSLSPDATTLFVVTNAISEKSTNDSGAEEFK